jgi:CRISPR-associated protein Cas5 subtype I-B
MASRSLIYASIRAWTATFKMPGFYSNTGIKSAMPTMDVPPYTTIIGMLGNMIGQEIVPDEAGSIGYVFEYDRKGVDLEKLESYTLDPERGILRRNLGSTNPTRREFLLHPRLHLYLENIALFGRCFREPTNIPCLGRSQDIAWLETLENGEQSEIVEADEVPQGIIRNTLIPFPQEGVGGIIIPLVDSYQNDEIGSFRRARRISKYQIVTRPASVRRSSLFKVSNREDCVIYMHAITP